MPEPAKYGRAHLFALLALSLQAVGCASSLRCVDTVGALRSLQPNRWHCAYVAGYNIPNDGGGGHFWWDRTSALDDNGGTVIAPYRSPAQGRWLRDVESSVSVKAFGATGKGLAPDTDAIQRAAKYAAGGGTIFFPSGRYLFESLSLDRLQLIHFCGVGGDFARGQLNASTLVYTGSAPVGISMVASSGVTFENMQFSYDNPAFTGSLISLGSVGDPNAFASYCVFTNCFFQYDDGANPTSPESFVQIAGLLDGNFRACEFSGAKVGIEHTTNYANGLQIENCVFTGQGSSAIRDMNGGQSWSIAGCTFEPLADGKAGAFDGDPNHDCQGFSITGCWMGDPGAPGGTYIKTGTVDGLVVQNDFFEADAPASPTTAVTFTGRCQGVQISGNEFFTQLGIEFPCPNCGTPCVTPPWRVLGISITGNDFAGTLGIHNFECQGNISIIGNHNAANYP